MIFPDKKIQYQLDQLRETTSSEFAGMAWIEHDENRIRWIYVSGNKNVRYKQFALKPGHGLAGLVIRLGRPVKIHPTLVHFELVKHDYPIMSVEQLQSAIAVPITIQGETKGVLLVGNRVERIYQPDDLTMLSTAADRLASLYLQSKSMLTRRSQ